MKKPSFGVAFFLWAEVWARIISAGFDFWFGNSADLLIYLCVTIKN